MAERFPLARTIGRRAADQGDPGATEPWTVVRTVLIVAATLGALWIAFELETLILLLIFAALFAYLMCPLVSIVERRLLPRRDRTMRRGVAIAVTYLIVLTAIASLVSWIAPRVAEAAQEVPERLSATTAGAHPIVRAYEWLHLVGISDDVTHRAVASASAAAESLAGRLAGTFVYLATFLPWLVLIPILAFFFLKDDRALTAAAIRLVPRRWRGDAPALLQRIDVALSGYVRAQLFACVIIGTIVGVGLALMQVPFAAVLGVASALAEFLPIVGPIAIAVLAAGVAMLQSPFLAVWVLVFLGVLRVAEDYVIYPRLIGSRVHLHPLAVILAVLAGGELGGVVGVLLAVPALAIGSAIYRYFQEPEEDEYLKPVVTNS